MCYRLCWNSSQMSYIIEENRELSPIHVTIDSSSDESDSGGCKHIRHLSKNYDYADENDGYDLDYDNDFFQPMKYRNTQSKSLKQFLFVIGFASTLIILSQLYLTFYYGEPLGSVKSDYHFYAFVAIILLLISQ